ncbi:DegT/DnrJ/EryC1/StrS family aminotransferase [Leucothrix pacifica]|uniref:Aminotransferase n=1 Tax=Leucothrix pacifica TaxID=1247513 RepID=A0A317C0B8_9GAMM|nr:aminotransferase class I/II-fold pyridoxal phosphate-dependent enzyme [Leucothrix pacifica]PWQ91998.1 aminotransferase [Leucothrix pacifica]
MTNFTKPFTQQEPIPESGIERAVEVMRSGRLHRYNTLAGELSETELLEKEYAEYQGVPYCLACASGGYALHVALKAAGLKQGEPVLTNAFTLAPVPGAINNAGGTVVLVEIDENYCVDLAHLEQMIEQSGSRFFMMSHMRGHLADMDAVVEICEKHGVTLIEDCAHTMGASWNGKKSGNFGRVACFSTQTYKHINSGEGGFLTTDDEELMARAVMHSGSYMLFERHGAAPSADVFADIRLDTPNYSGRMDNLRAAILRAQLPLLSENVDRWNARYRSLESGLSEIDGVVLSQRHDKEYFVGSSIQFRVPQLSGDEIPQFIGDCAAKGVELKWFGNADPQGFTSRYDSWRYLGDAPKLPQTLKILDTTFDMRVPLTFDLEDTAVIVQVIKEVLLSDGEKS